MSKFQIFLGHGTKTYKNNHHGITVWEKQNPISDLDSLQRSSLCSCHTVPKKIATDGHTTMDLPASHEDCPDIVQNPVNSEIKYEGYRRVHDGNTISTRLPPNHGRTTLEGNSSTKRLLHDVILLVTCVLTRLWRCILPLASRVDKTSLSRHSYTLGQSIDWFLIENGNKWQNRNQSWFFQSCDWFKQLWPVVIDHSNVSVQAFRSSRCCGGKASNLSCCYLNKSEVPLQINV